MIALTIRPVLLLAIKWKPVRPSKSKHRWTNIRDIKNGALHRALEEMFTYSVLTRAMEEVRNLIPPSPSHNKTTTTTATIACVQRPLPFDLSWRERAALHMLQQQQQQRKQHKQAVAKLVTNLLPEMFQNTSTEMIQVYIIPAPAKGTILALNTWNTRVVFAILGRNYRDRTTRFLRPKFSFSQILMDYWTGVQTHMDTP